MFLFCPEQLSEYTINLLADCVFTDAAFLKYCKTQDAISLDL